MRFWYTALVDGVRDLLTDVCLVGVAVFSIAWLMLISRGRVARTAEFVLRTPRSHLAAFLTFAIVATLCAQKPGGTNSPPNGVSPPQMAGVPTPGLVPPILLGAVGTVSVTSNDVARGFRLESVSTNGSYSYAMPTNGTRYEKWWKRGAYEEVFRLDLDGMRVPLGTNLCNSLWVYTWGMAGAHLGDTQNRIAATGVPMSAVPDLSQFWSAALPGGMRRLTWQDFALNRDTNTPVSAQLELMPSGDFVARSNLVESVYHRINPDDWDDDGDPNGTDPDPYAYDGDNFGPHQTLPEGANSNAYCWVDIVVQNANALVTFSGDGQSALPDPRFIARAGETNRVTILIGKAYQVTCQMPIACTGTSDSAVDVDQVAAGELSICWPVEIYSVGMRGGASFSMSVWPDCLGGDFVWTNSCCSLSSSGGVFTYSCNDSCHCTGCAARGYYGYEGYRIPAYGGSCGCPSNGEYDERPGEEDDGPYNAGASAVFSKSAVIFEDAYTNSPGDGVGRQSTQTELHCVAHGGPNGGHVRFAIVGADKLERVSGHILPVEQDVSPGKKLDFSITYKGRLPSTTAEDIVVTTTFAENVSGATPSSSQTKLTSVKVLVVSTNFSLDPYPYRHIRGIGETFFCELEPSAYGMSIQAQNGAVCIANYDNQSNILCPYNTASKIVKIQTSDATYEPDIRVLVPTDIEARNPRMLPSSVPVNSPGGAGFQMDLHILPDTVSFQALEFWERASETPESSTIEGYFTNVAFSAVWYHNANMLAGVWHKISDDNYWFTDAAQMDDELITPVCPGILVWHIPVDWRVYNNPTILHGNFKLVDQGFEMSANGRLTVSKYGHWAARDMNGATDKSEGME